ncbi:MAG: hypothetical protein ACRD01_12660 [Terriglobales bacterium]
MNKTLGMMITVLALMTATVGLSNWANAADSAITASSVMATVPSNTFAIGIADPAPGSFSSKIGIADPAPGSFSSKIGIADPAPGSFSSKIGIADPAPGSLR